MEQGQSRLLGPLRLLDEPQLYAPKGGVVRSLVARRGRWWLALLLLLLLRVATCFVAIQRGTPAGAANAAIVASKAEALPSPLSTHLSASDGFTAERLEFAVAALGLIALFVWGEPRLKWPLRVVGMVALLLAEVAMAYLGWPTRRSGLRGNNASPLRDLLFAAGHLVCAVCVGRLLVATGAPSGQAGGGSGSSISPANAAV